MAEIFASSSRVVTVEGLSCGKARAEGFLESGYGVVPLVKFAKDPCAGLSTSMDNETGLDPPARKSGLYVAADYFALGYFVWVVFSQLGSHWI
ncbi:Phospholipid:diacylglycerol acyltransferase 1 [Olea europaea subsp. europaea]|uniref:Phospholipid:diacylglycerol acyltransferase 1 n=1 Tax=Olea europaea subsp. europaea TaxID=158383 RepID=A0A8S0PSY7_OLEEU|nr:Phospholipid:diacylglycerol acyltransferase 1 [Olea europaea subsp. europaea]